MGNPPQHPRSEAQTMPGRGAPLFWGQVLLASPSATSTSDGALPSVSDALAPRSLLPPLEPEELSPESGRGRRPGSPARTLRAAPPWGCPRQPATQPACLPGKLTLPSVVGCRESVPGGQQGDLRTCRGSRPLTCSRRRERGRCRCAQLPALPCHPPALAVLPCPPVQRSSPRPLPARRRPAVLWRPCSGPCRQASGAAAAGLPLPAGRAAAGCSGSGQKRGRPPALALEGCAAARAAAFCVETSRQHEPTAPTQPKTSSRPPTPAG